MTITDARLSGVKILTPKVIKDQRGYFYECYRQSDLQHIFVQENYASSIKNTLRGLHYQSNPGQNKLIMVTKGKILDVVVDIRLTSPTLGKWMSIELSEDNKIQLFVPIGFAHGYVVLSDMADVTYKCTSYYNKETECGIAWNDNKLGIDWQIKSKPILSERDTNNISFNNYIDNTKVHAYA